MSYIRVLPRDLFNEASLLKCYGRLWIILDERRGHSARFVTEDVDHFGIVQRQEDGSLFISNVEFTIAGRRYLLTRPLNSREDWPLYVEDIDDMDAEPVEVFNSMGYLSPGMCHLIQWEV